MSEMTGTETLCFFSADLSERLEGILPSRTMDELFGAIRSGELKRGAVAVLSHGFLAGHEALLSEWLTASPASRLVILSPERRAAADYVPIPAASIHTIAPSAIENELLAELISGAMQITLLEREKAELRKELTYSQADLERLARVGQALANEHNFERLIELILNQARELAAADGGSIYVVERENNKKPTHLRFKKSALHLNADEFLLPIDSESIAGYVALKGAPLLIDDVYALSGDEDYRFNLDFDRLHGYHTKSMMVIPMKNHRDEIIGVIQLINRKRHFHQTLHVEDMKGNAVIPFDERSLKLVSAMAGQAAVAIMNNNLLSDINNLFEGFVKASVTAIEQRDPTTSGHSFRVAELTVGLARAVDRLSSGKFAAVHFSSEQIREVRYASLLHDFGKVGVREKVLVKARKLYDSELDIVRWRFRYIRKTIQKEYADRLLSHIRTNGIDDLATFENLLNAERDARLARIDSMLNTILTSNEPAIVEEGNFEMLEKIARSRIRLEDGQEIPFLSENELVSLSVRRGNLNQNERLEIESHVSHTYRFLVQIPWTGDLSRVPELAHGHHEKLDGTGYPRGLSGDEIAIQTRMMTIADIYDALTAPDRPYKKSLSAERALDILQMEARSSHVDVDLLSLFIEAKVFELIEKR